MGAINLKKSDAIVFQLLRKNLAGIDEPARIWKEIKVVTLAVKPSFIDYNYRNRSQINQTQERSGFVDKYGMLFTQVNMGGSFGIQPRRVGLSLKDGYTRLMEFRDEIVKKSNRVNDELDQKEGTSQIFGGNNLGSDANAKYVYAVNFYDFINNEMFAIDITTFSIRLDSAFNTVLPTYKLGFQEIGDIIKVNTMDGVLRALLAVSSVMDTIENEINYASNYITDSPIFQAVEFGLTMVEDIINQANNLSDTIILYAAATSGIATSIKNRQINTALQFSSVKG